MQAFGGATPPPPHCRLSQPRPVLVQAPPPCAQPCRLAGSCDQAARRACGRMARCRPRPPHIRLERQPPPALPLLPLTCTCAGYHYFFSAGSPDTGTFWASWFFGWAFNATSSTIVSGALAERAQFRRGRTPAVHVAAVTRPAQSACNPAACSPGCGSELGCGVKKRAGRRPRRALQRALV